VAVGELDANFGNNPALLTGVGSGSPTLVFPLDRDDSRTVPGVYDINVTTVDPSVLDVPASATSTGLTPYQSPPSLPYTSIVVRKNRGERVGDLWVAQLAALPQVTMNVTYNGSSHHTETGPTIADVLHKLGFAPRRDTAVWAVGTPFGSNDLAPTAPGGGNSTYSTAVTPAEAGPGHRPLLISLTETPPPSSPPATTPRLIPAGDGEGARYNSNFATLTILDTAGEPAPGRTLCAGPPVLPSVNSSMTSSSITGAAPEATTSDATAERNRTTWARRS
jgi:hypothetical protein